ncbi:hypothetical protein ACOME3_009434 [Neoechinorhynchus agilis]
MNFDLKSLAEGANKMLNRMQQVTQETLGKSEKTQLDPNLEASLKRVEKQKIWIDRLIEQADGLIQPSQVEKLEGFILSKIGQSVKDKPNVLEALGRLMLDASVDIGPNSMFGSSLKTIGEVEVQLGKIKKETNERILSGFVQPLHGFIEGDLKDLQKERKNLENARFELDAAKMKMKQANNDSEPDVELGTCQAAFERQMEVTKILVDQIESSANSRQLKCLVDLVEAQRDYHSKCASLLNALKDHF